MTGAMGYHRESLIRPGGSEPLAEARLPPAHLVLMVARQRAPNRALIDCLAQRGLRCIWIDGLPGLERAASQVAPDAIVYDAQADPLPLAQALSQLRARFSGVVLVLDDSHDEVDEILALELGADGLLPHPVAPRRLRARLEALLRRAQPETLQAIGDAVSPELPAGWQLDPVQNMLHRHDQRIELTASQMQLLRCLARHVGRVVPRAELHHHVCAPDSDLRARSIDVYVHRLRQRLAAAGVIDLQVDAVRGRGFILRQGAVTPADPAAPHHGVYLNS
jgi:DNA-binding response OmpR family regulator